MTDQSSYESDQAPTPLDFLQKNLIDFFQNAPVGIHSLSEKGIILWANDAELNSLGYTAEEYIGHPVTEVIRLLSIFKMCSDLYSSLSTSLSLNSTHRYFSSFLSQVRKNI
jgi:PAS domain S-box-containing protein